VFGECRILHFEKNPEICPNCSAFMIKDVVFSFLADKEIQKLVKTHGIEKGAECFLPSVAHSALARP
jgi:hypothetical protein